MSSDRMFLIAADILDPGVDPKKIRDVLKDKHAITGWWNHIPGCFLVTSDLDPEHLTDAVRSATGDARLLVMRVDPSASEGWLPERSWHWIRRRETEDAH